MKRLSIFALIIFFFISCEESIKHYSIDIYLNNELAENLTLEVFKENELLIFDLNPNDSVFLGAFNYTKVKGDKNVLPIDQQAYARYLGSIDSVNVFYNNKKYTYNHTNQDIHILFEARRHFKTAWIVDIDENKKQNLGWE